MRLWPKWKVLGVWKWWLLVLICNGVACGPALRIRHQDPSAKKVAVQINGKLKGTLEFGQEQNFSLSEGVYKLQILALPGNINKWSDDGQPWEFYLNRSVEVTLLPVQSASEGEWDLLLPDQDPQVIQEEEKKQQFDGKKVNKTGKARKTTKTKKTKTPRQNR